MTPRPPASGSPEVVASSKVAPASPAPVKPIVQNPDGALVTPAGKAVRPNATLAIDGNTGSPVGVTRNLEIPKELSKGKSTTLVQADPKNLKTGDAFTAKVTWVKDGDTADLSNGVVCRINGIDAPETAKPKKGQPAQAFSGEATRALEDMVRNKEVTVRIVEPPTGSNYGRASCIIEVEGKDVNLAMVQKGLGWFWGKYVQDSFRYQTMQAAEAKAKKDKTGLWVDPNPIFPNTYQRQYR